MVLNWTDNSSNETGFIIERAANSAFTGTITTYTVGANVKTFTNTVGTLSYFYRVAATNVVGAKTDGSGAPAAPGFPTATMTSAWSNVSGTPATPTKYDHTASQIQYYSATNQYTQSRPGTTGSPWSTFNTGSAYGGSYARATSASASIVIPFNGTQLTVIAMRGTTVGKVDFSVDGGTVTTVDLYRSAGAQYQQAVYTTPALAAGLHFVTIKKNPAATSGQYVTLDAVEVLGTLVSVTQTQQTDARFVYVPNPWSTFTSTSASGGSYARTSAEDSNVTLKFNGLRFDYIGMKGTTLGICDVLVDGTVKATLNLYQGTAQYQQVIWSTGWLPAGSHTIQIRRNGGSPGGRYTTIDRADVWGALQ
jgi:hypothetical protein